ncbi:hypothetical protein LTR78_006038 [Recurvomyces mirabilis]|uniref:Uncharacterized protein n=1 Tax=Recurvomyces mirabilis TaxID=574656 RepID=A0AAE0WM14_9PEZI|nr:hypothetical protein LTR78_006038 [Recurvomyces mirabilis]
MGVVISKTGVLTPISVASIIIGFVSFAFTVATFLRVLWTNFMTLGEAPHEVHAYLTNLRTELLEERANLKVMKKNYRRHHKLIQQGGRGSRVDSGMELDDVTIKTMNDTIRYLIKRFKEIEKPFLEPGELGISGDTNPRKRRRRSRSESPYDQSYNSPPEKAHGRGRYDDDVKDPRMSRYADERGIDEDDDKYWAQRTQYAQYSFKKRMTWLYKKGDAQSLFEALTRVQTRRIARQVAGISCLVHEYGSSTLEMQDSVRRIDERMSRFVGFYLDDNPIHNATL